MNIVRASITSACLAFLVTACGSTSPGGGGDPTGGSGGNSNGGSGGNSNGGSGGNESGGSGGTSNGGAGGVSNGGSGGVSNGGAGGVSNGGAGGVSNGGSGGTVKGGAGGTARAGAGGTVVGGAGGSVVAGAGGSVIAGAGGGAGGKTGTGGVSTGTGGGTTSNGGVQGTGGTTNVGSGGSTAVASTALVTSASGNYWKPGTWTEATSGTADVTVNDTSASQTWEGFGGTFNEKGWGFLTSKALQDEAIKLLFGDEGCRFTWGRVPIGASDYAMDRYTLNENAGDTSMSKFSIERDKEKLIPYIKAALAVKPDIRFWASPWTPPTWMKSNNAFDGGNMKSDSATLDAFALYEVKFIQAYKEQGIEIEAIAPQNEPGFSQTYPTCLWDKATFVSYVKKLGPALTAAGLSTKVMLGTMSNADAGKDPDIAAAVLADSTAKGIVKMIGVQWGMLDAAKLSPLKSSGLPIWVSEHKCGNYPWNPSGYPTYKEPAPNDHAYGKESWGYIRDAIKNGITSYNAWNMVLDKMGKGIDTSRQWAQDSLLVVDGGKIIQTPAYYVFRHFAQYVDPGAKVVGTSGGEAIGFKNPDGSIVAVLYASSAKSNYIVKIGGKNLQFSMPADGWATVKYKP